MQLIYNYNFGVNSLDKYEIEDFTIDISDPDDPYFPGEYKAESKEVEEIKINELLNNDLPNGY